MAVKEIWTPTMNADWSLAAANKPVADYDWLDDSYRLSNKTYTDPVTNESVTFNYNGSAGDRIVTNPNHIWRDDNGYARLGHKSKNAYLTGCGYNYDNYTDSALLNRTRLSRLPHVCGITMQYRWPDANDSDYAHVHINGQKGCWLSYFNFQRSRRYYLRCEPCNYTGVNPTSSSGIKKRGMDWKVMAFRLSSIKRDFVRDENLDFLGFTFQFEYNATTANVTRVMDFNHLNLIFDSRVSGAVPVLFKRRVKPWSNDPFETTPPEFFLKDPS